MRAGLKEFLHFKHGKESNNINHFPGVYLWHIMCKAPLFLT